MKYLLFVPLIICGFSFTNISKVNPINEENFFNTEEDTDPPCDDASVCPDYGFFIADYVSGNDVYLEVRYDITAFNVIESGVTMVYDAGRRVRLNPGFHAKRGSNFRAFIEGCCGTTSLEDRSDTSASEEEADLTMPPDTDFALYNFPNPFTQQTTIEYNLPNDSPVTLTVTDMAGKRLAVLVNHERQGRGIHTSAFDGTNYPAGTYYYTIQAGDFVKTQKMTLVK